MNADEEGFTRPHKGHVSFFECLHVEAQKNGRVIVHNAKGNVMLNCSQAVYEACWKKGYFMECRNG